MYLYAGGHNNTINKEHHWKLGMGSSKFKSIHALFLISIILSSCFLCVMTGVSGFLWYSTVYLWSFSYISQEWTVYPKSLSDQKTS